jgi:hypothetical protein
VGARVYLKLGGWLELPRPETSSETPSEQLGHDTNNTAPLRRRCGCIYSLVVVLAVLDVILVHHGDLTLGRILLPLWCELPSQCVAGVSQRPQRRARPPGQRTRTGLYTYIQEVDLLEELLLVMLELTHCWEWWGREWVGW